jgi:hypothetical protein
LASVALGSLLLFSTARDYRDVALTLGALVVLIVVLGILRLRSQLPIFGTLTRPWETLQLELLDDAEEYDLAEEYRTALETRDAKALG